MKKLRLGIIGCGSIGNFHLYHLIRMEDAEVSAVCDAIPEKAEKARGKTGAKAYTDYREMLEKERLDAIFVGVPPYMLPGIELDIISRGIHLFIQKPMALSMEHANKVKAAIEKSGVINAVGFQDRYLDVAGEIAAFLHGKKTGLFRGSWLGGIAGVYWWQKKETGGGQIVEQSIHIFDMTRMFFGEAKRVTGIGGTGIVTPGKGAVPEDFDLEDFSSVTIEYENGVIGNILTGCYLTTPAKSGLDIFTDNGCAYYQLRQSVEFVEKGGRTLRLDVNNDNGYDCDRAFVEAVIKNDQSMIRSPYADAVKSLQLALTSQEAVETGRAIEL